MLAVDGSLPNLLGEQWQPLESQEGMKKIEFRDNQYQLKNHHVGCGWEEQCRTWSYLQKGNDFSDLPLQGRSRIGVETSEDGWTWLTTSVESVRLWNCVFWLGWHIAIVERERERLKIIDGFFELFFFVAFCCNECILFCSPHDLDYWLSWEMRIRLVQFVILQKFKVI